MKADRFFHRQSLPAILIFSMLIFNSCTKETTLKEAYAGEFVVGAALNTRTFAGNDTASSELVQKHFNSITSTNDLKWERIHPKPGEYTFERADMFVNYGEEHNMHVVGHVLIWHSQTPSWVFLDENGDTASREVMLERMKDHIETVMTRYRGRIHTWDVVNEALADDGSLRENNWYKAIGDDWVEKAFEFAQGIDPEVSLIYNDYSLANPAKRDGAVRLIQSLQEKGLKVDGIGMQGHYHLDNPSLENLEASIVAFSDLGIEVHITELDVNVLPSPWNYIGANVEMTHELHEELNPYPDSLPAEVQDELAVRYAGFFRIFREHHEHIERVTFWGESDRSSWLNNWPVRGRTNYPLLFDRELQPKPAFDAVMKVAGE
ncbi:MAG: endo-1,4-beta-xylanase [Bacteroidales bacterium]